MTSTMTLQDNQVLQRGEDGTARVTLDTGETVTLPAGGPYEVGGAQNVFVGDLWVLAGQSNMEGAGDLAEDEVALETPHPRVHSFQSRESWARAEEPLHWLTESPHVVHHTLVGQAKPENIPPRDPARRKGSGLGLTFAKLRVEETGVPIGLIPAAHGGTSMRQWDPSRRDLGGASLYGATLARVRALGGQVAGILWYQGESDTNPADADVYEQRMTALVQAFRSDFSQPDLPFYYVQLGVFVSDPRPESVEGWNRIRESQRVLADRLPNVAVVSAINLDLDDPIHIGTAGQKALGRRLAAAAAGQPAPALRSFAWEPERGRLRVSFDHVQGGLQSLGRATGFSLRDPSGNELPVIYKVSLDGSDALLKIEDQGRVPGAHLWYGYGLNPYCNITDVTGAAIPAFGPLPVE